MNSDRLAEIIAASIARHQTRGLVDSATGMDDVVIHGRANLRHAAQDVLAALQQNAGKRSWSPYFSEMCANRRAASRHEQRKSDLLDLLEDRLNNPDAAIARLRLRQEFD